LGRLGLGDSEESSLANLVLPKVELDISTREYGRFIVSPLQRGYGTTIGNALRRVLLSSLPGAAVTAIRLSDAYHEYSDIPYVREDMIGLVLNVKRLRFRMVDGVPARVHVSAHGQGIVTGADVECPPDVEVMNPELYLFTVDSDDAEIYMEMVVERGVGYSPVEERDHSPSIGEILVDAVFSPVRKVSYDVGQARVGQSTDYDALTLEVWTDGTIEPQEALDEAVGILMRHFAVIGGEGVSLPDMEAPEEEGRGKEELERKTMPIEELGLSVRVYNCLKRAGISQVGEVLDKLSNGDEEMLAIRNFGVKSLEELKEKLKAHGFHLPGERQQQEEE
jgi:DNA-directed RNA polymerase subunit alpha